MITMPLELVSGRSTFLIKLYILPSIQMESNSIIILLFFFGKLLLSRDDFKDC